MKTIGLESALKQCRMTPPSRESLRLAIGRGKTWKGRQYVRTVPLAVAIQFMVALGREGPKVGDEFQIGEDPQVYRVIKDSVS